MSYPALVSHAVQLSELLSTMEPDLDPREFVYAFIPSGETRPGHAAICRFEEAEGETLIMLRGDAEQHGLAFAFECKKITLRVHSSLEAVGFLAAIAAELVKSGIAANCVSAYYHDHLFVPSARAEEALQILNALQRRSLGKTPA